VITEELLPYISEHYNIRTDRNGRAIGGFSMGGDGALRIAIRNSEKFIAVSSHSGAPALDAFRPFLPEVLAESPEDEPPYSFDPGNGPATESTFGLASAFSPYPPALPHPNPGERAASVSALRGEAPPYDVYFPILPSGELDESVFTGLWIENHDAIQLLRDPLVYTTPISIHFETGTGGDSAFPFNELLHQQMGEEFPHSYATHPGGHLLPPDRVEWTLVWLHERMNDATAAAPETASSGAAQLKGNSPNPARDQTVISYSVESDGPVQLDLLDAQGREVRSLVRGHKRSGNHQIHLDTRELPAGVYFYRLNHDERSESRKLIVTR
jgi:hypothetical protein